MTIVPFPHSVGLRRKVPIHIPPHIAFLLDLIEGSLPVFIKLAEIAQRFPYDVEYTVLREFFLLITSVQHDFVKERGLVHVTRIMTTHNIMYKELARHMRLFPEERQALVRVKQTNLQFPFVKKKVLSFIIGITPIGEYERFSEKHILRAVQNLIPNVSVVPGSFHVRQDLNDRIRMLYVELAKDDGETFSLQEVRRLLPYLPNAFKEHINHSLPCKIKIYRRIRSK